MSIRRGNKIIAGTSGGGGGTNVLVDDKTIIKNNEDIITTVGVQSKTGETLHDWIGTLEEYEVALADGTIQENWLCYVTDDVDDNSDFYKSILNFSLFDTKIADHVLEGQEAKGWALQGTYVSGALYPDFYNRCLEEKNSATANETTLADSTLTIYVNSNGHQFYNIADKSIVDTFYEAFGIADFYGIDEENERIFLPRNKYFAVTGGVMGNGMSLGLVGKSKAGNYVGLGLISDGTDNHYIKYNTGTDGTLVGTVIESSSGTYPENSSFGLLTDPTKSGIVLQPNENKYLYYCVGNTVVNDAEIDAGALVSEMEKKASKVDVDGLPVFITLSLINGFTESMSQTFDLSDYLPNDNYCYEVFVTGYGDTGATSGNTLSLSVATSLHSSLQIFACRTRSASNVNGGGACSAYVGLDRQITISNTGQASTGTSFIELRGYRRLGTNV